MEDRREVHRVDLSSNPCTVEARFEDRVACGMGVDLNSKGLGATFQSVPSGVLPLVGEVGHVLIAADWLKSRLSLEARVVRRSDIAAAICLFGFEFLASADEVDSQLRRVFDPRQAFRLQPPRNKPVEVVIIGASGLREVATLQDVSFTGIGLEVDIDSERRIGTTSEVELELPLPSGDEPLTVPAAIRHRHYVGESRVVVGLVFRLPRSATPIQKAIDDYVMTLQRRQLANALQVRD